MQLEALKKLQINVPFASIFQGFDLEGTPEVEVTENGISLVAHGYGDYQPSDEWFTAKQLADRQGCHTQVIYKNAEKRPATNAEKAAHRRASRGNSIHYMYR